MSSSGAKDLFSSQAKQYARFRPHYPDSLIQYVASLPDRHDCAWDCGTGNGQAAVSLAPYFEKVIATDVNFEQIKNAKLHPKVEYSVAPAEKTSIPTASVDLVTVVQAAHWFDLDQFVLEVQRVLKPGGWVALWTYGHNRKMTPSLDEILEHFSSEVVGKYWSERIQLIADQYKTIPFPFKEVSPPLFKIEHSFTLDELIGYLSSWSATQEYIRHEGKDPLPALRSELEKFWGTPGKTYRMIWPIHFRVGQKT